MKMVAIAQYELFLKKYYNQGKGPVINPLPVTKPIPTELSKLKPQGSFLMTSSQKESNAQVSVQNFAFSNSNSTAKKQPNADLAGIGTVGGKGGNAGSSASKPNMNNRLASDSPAQNAQQPAKLNDPTSNEKSRNPDGKMTAEDDIMRPNSSQN